MKKTILVLTASLMIGLAGAAVASAEEGQPAPTVTPPPPADASKCALKTGLSADMVAKCTEAMAKGDKAMLEGCCQEDESLENSATTK